MKQVHSGNGSEDNKAPRHGKTTGKSYECPRGLNVEVNKMATTTSTMEDFISLLRIEEIALRLIDHTWSLVTLRSMRELVNRHCNVGSCDPERLIRAINVRYVTSNSIAIRVMRHHKMGPGDDECHICGEMGGHSRDHYSTHIKGDPTHINGDGVATRAHLLDKENCRCKLRCDVCGKDYPTSAKLRRHVKQVHYRFRSIKEE